MGGGGSSSVNKTYNNIDVKPITNVQFDTEEIANAINDATQVQKALVSMQKAGLAIEAKKTQIEEDKAKFNILQDIKKHEQLVLLALIVGGTYAYQKLKKGKI